MRKLQSVEGGIAPYVASLLTPSAARLGGAYAVVLSLLMLASCGFQPLHGQQYRSTLNVDLASVRVEVEGANVTPTATTTIVPRRYGELLRAEITDQVNPTAERAEKLFKLTISYRESQEPQFVNPDGTASRGDLVYNTTYVLTRLSDQKQVASGSIQRISSYNTSPTADYASYVSIQDARKRAMIELAQDYKLRLANLLPTLNNPEAQALAPTPDAKLPELRPVPGYETKRP